MASTKRSPLPPGRQPWDPANGLRAGVLAGGLAGALLVAITGFFHFWVVALAGIAGGAIGFWSERRKQQGRYRRSENDR